MRSSQHRIATRLSCLFVVCAISFAACATKTGESLAGSISCHGMTCGSGELCFDYSNDGSNGGTPGDQYSCKAVPAGCVLPASCSGADCPACIAQGPCTLEGRNLTCLAF
jgi:hypothetical protein